MDAFDVVVIGGGPGGYIAAIRAAQLGLKTACLDDWRGADGKPALGGTCTNVGCIPSKALLQSSEYFEQAGHQFADHGVKVNGLELDLAQMLKRKDKVVKASNDGVLFLFRKNKIQFFHGRGSFGAADEQIAREAAKMFARQGLAIELGSKVNKVSQSRKDILVQYTSSDNSSKTLECDRLIVSIGRLPNTDGLNAAAVGLKVDERGFIAVDGDCRTNLPNVWAIGDVVRGPMLAHKAEEEGVAVAERIVGQKPHVDFNTVPWVIYTTPEIAWVGETEQQLKARGAEYRAGSFPFAANARARALGDTSGLVKFLADAKTDQVLGVHIIGPFAGELIAEAVVAMEFRGSAEDIGMICHAHPSLSEAMKDAALAVDKRALNI